jgi:hypothetical protein
MVFKTLRHKSIPDLYFKLENGFGCELFNGSIPHLFPLTFDLNEFKSYLMRNYNKTQDEMDEMFKDVIVCLVKLEVYAT